jgi:hypothetical protein
MLLMKELSPGDGSPPQVTSYELHGFVVLPRDAAAA